MLEIVKAMSAKRLRESVMRKGKRGQSRHMEPKMVLLHVISHVELIYSLNTKYGSLPLQEF